MLFFNFVYNVSNPAITTRIYSQTYLHFKKKKKKYKQHNLKKNEWIQVVNSGQTATMNCTVEGFPIESVEWLHDGVPVLSAQDSRLRLPAPLVLMIGAIGRKDKGMYQCLVRSDKENAQATAELRLGG